MNYHELETSVGDRIRYYRMAKKMSQMDLAKKTEMSNTSISNFEKGHQKPSLVTLARLSQALEVSIDDLFFGDINDRFITTGEDKAAVIVNSVCKLWETDVLRIYQGEEFSEKIEHFLLDKQSIVIHNYQSEIVRLLKGLRDFYAHKDSYSDADGQLKALKESVTNEIRYKISLEKNN